MGGMSVESFNMKNSERGMTFVEVLVAFGILGVSLVGLMSFVTYSASTKTQSDTAAGAVLARDIVIQYINNPKAWPQTLAKNSEMSCILNSTDCSGYGTSPRSFALYDGESNAITGNSSSPTYGFKRSGEVCTAFDGTAGSGDRVCVFHYDLSWRAVCGPGCKNPQIEVSGTFKFNSDVDGNKNSSNIREDRYNFKFIRGSALESVGSQACSRLGGTVSGVSCILPMAGSCPPGQAVVGIDPTNNTKICNSPTGIVSPTMCLPGQVFKGRDDSGNSVCLPMDCMVGKLKNKPRPTPMNWNENPAATSFDAWSADGGDGGCDGMGGDGNCDGSGAGS